MIAGEGEVPLAAVAREFASRCLAHGVAPQDVVTAMTAAVVDVLVTFIGKDGMRDWLQCVADLMANSDETLQ